MAIDTEAKRWGVMAWATPNRTFVFNPDTSGVSAIERATLLELYGGNAFDSPSAGPTLAKGTHSLMGVGI